MKHAAFADNPREEVKAFLPALRLAFSHLQVQQKRLQTMQEQTTPAPLYKCGVFEQAAYLRARSLVRLAALHLGAVVQNLLWQAPEAAALVASDIPPGIFADQQMARDLGLVFEPLPNLTGEHGAPGAVYTMNSIDANINASVSSIQEYLELANTCLDTAAALLDRERS